MKAKLDGLILRKGEGGDGGEGEEDVRIYGIGEKVFKWIFIFTRVGVVLCAP